MTTGNNNEQTSEALKEALKIYSETVADHCLHPRNMGPIQDYDGFGRFKSPDGDVLEVWIKVRQGTIIQAGFSTNACAATMAAGSMLTVLAEGKTLAQADLITPAKILTALGGLPEGNRHSASMAAQALKAALRDYYVNQRDPWKKLYRK